MAISLNGGTGVITGVSVGGLPDGIVDTDMLAADAVTDAKQNLSGVAKAWVNFDGTASDITSTVNGYNVSTITDEGTGQYTINFTTDFANTNYAVTHGSKYAAGNGYFHWYHNEAVGSIGIRFISSAGSYTDSAHVSCVVFGD